ncbi:pectate lyase [Flindersiella endophytica]
MLSPQGAQAQADGRPAFPGAEGFGAYATGGRGGSVYYVTNLDDSGPGSFRDAVSRPNRTVVFAVGGIITLESRVSVAPNLTIAGQTAPGGGITIYGDGLSFTGADNTIARYFRVRQGVGGTSGTDTIGITYGKDLIFDHLSVSWGRDENFSVTAGDLNKPLDEQPVNITIQNSIISQGLDPHSAGGLIESAGPISILHNLYVDNNIRSVKAKGVHQYVNNLVYNWRTEGFILGGSQYISRANIENSYFIAGPETVTEPFIRGNENFNLYASKNFHDPDRDGTLNGYEMPREEYTTVTWHDEPFDYPSVRTWSPQEAYRHVLANAGASNHRDRIDRFVVDEVKSLGTEGVIISDETAAPINGPGPIAGGTAPQDTDLDGMPDAWERATGSDPRVADNNGDLNDNGYTNLEDYLNWLADR